MKKKIKQALKPAVNVLLKVLMQGAKKYPGRVLFDENELALLRQALLSQNLFGPDGSMVAAFEKEFAVLYGAPYAVASTSGTAAIHTALGGLDLDGGDEIITAPITDLGTIIPILYQNCIPVFADIDETCQMDPEDIERKITPRTKAIVVVHLFGNACNMEKIVDVAKRHGIPLVEDCSQTHVTEYKGKYLGTWGDIGCYSFQQSKHMTTGDGGMTITFNKNYYERMKLFVDKGYARKGWGSRAYLFHAPNYRMNELTGAVGRAQIKKVKAVIEKRNAMGQLMTRLLQGIPGVTPIPGREGVNHSYWLYPFRLEGANLEVFCKEMISKGVYAMAGYTGKPIYLCTESLTAKKTYGNSQLPFTSRNVDKTYEYKEGLCPNAEKMLETLVCIPWNESWGEAGVQRAVDTIKQCLQKVTGKTVMSSASTPIPADTTPRAEEKMGGKKINVAIIGCGQIGRSHLDAYKQNPHIKLVACVDTDLSRAEQFARDAAGAKVYSTHQALLENESVQVASVCTVPSTHRQIVCDLLEAGVHVLCEKPLAMTVSEAQVMLAKAQEKNRLLITAFKLRFFEEVIKTKELLEKGTLGKILNIRLIFGGYMDMAGTWFVKKEISGGGVIMDNGPHAIDLIQYLFGEMDSVDTQALDAKNVGIEDTAKINFSLKSGVKGTIDVSWAAWVTPDHYLEIYGDEGAVFLDMKGITYKYKTWSEWKRVANKSGPAEGFNRQIDHFIEAVQKNRTSVIGSEAGLKAQKVIEAAYKSLAEKSKINVY